MYDAIIVGGISYDFSGRPIGPYRLRTAAEKENYSIKIVDYASSLNDVELLLLLAKLITPQTKILGFSGSWIEINEGKNSWSTKNFFNLIKKMFPQISIVLGGTKTIDNSIIKNFADWFITGFADIPFTKLLNILSGKNDKLLYLKDNNGIKVVDSDLHYRVFNMDDIETVYKKDDGFLPYQPLTIEISRGCIFSCAYCTHPFLGKKSFEYIRSAENLSLEFKRNYDLFGTTRYFFADDTFNDSIEKIERVTRAVELAKLPNFEFVGYIRPELLVTTPSMIGMLKNLGLKGAHFGIESFNNYARKSIGKGMDVNRVLDMSRKFYSDTKVKVHATMILGLPNDTEDDFYKWQEILIKSKDEMFVSWRYNALGIMNPKFGKAYSLIEKDPKKYGYECPDSDLLFLNWKNKDTNNERCNEIATELNRQCGNYIRPAAFMLGGCWFHNISEYQIDNKTVNEINLLKTAKINHKKRTIEELKKHELFSLIKKIESKN